jgi:hypothetical protein
MAYSTPASTAGTSRATDARHSVMAAYQILHIGYFLLPVLAGIDKFTRALVDWDKYLAPTIAQTVGMTNRTFMTAVGMVEILAGLLVAFAPRIGGYVVAMWLAGIIVNLSMNPTPYWDVALRDFGLMLGALALAKISGAVKKMKEGG